MKSILDYGAKGNGVDDDTVAIQAAIDAGGAEFPERTFRFSKQLTIKKPCNLWGTGATLLAPKFIQNAIVLNAAKHVTIHGLAIQAVAHTLLSNSGACEDVEISRCELLGTFPTTNYLINFENSKGVAVEDCQGSGTQYGFRFGSGMLRSRIAYCEIQNWLQYAYHIWSGAAGTRDIELYRNSCINPLAGKGSRQGIVVLSDPDNMNRRNVSLRILYNIMRGESQPYNPANPAANKGSGDLIVLHNCSNFLVEGNEAYYGGEIGITVSRFCKYGVISKNSIRGNDAHGLQVSGLNDRCEYITISNNRIYNNGLRKDGKADVMSQLYLQDAEDILIEGNQLEDLFEKRRCKSGIQMALCENVTIPPESNQITFKDAVGAVPILEFKRPPEVKAN